jgi:D-alanine-D-alanine ligase-like ATP-grasp enzyme
LTCESLRRRRKVTGKLVKVAGKDFFVTNAAQKLLTLENAWKESAISHINIKTLEKDIDEVCLLAANQLEKGNKKIDIIGFDIGISDQGDIWIIEGNYVPDLTMFNKGEFEQMYKNIGNAKKR